MDVPMMVAGQGVREGWKFAEGDVKEGAVAVGGEWSPEAMVSGLGGG